MLFETDSWHGEFMQIPPLSPFDIESLEPVTLQATLLLPKLATEDVQSATHLFSGFLADGGYCDAQKNPKEMIELLTRCLVAVTTELMEEPNQVLSYFGKEHFAVCTERTCDVLVATGAGASENARWIEERIGQWQLSDEQRGIFRASAVTIAVGSLATLGRLPLSEVPSQDFN